ncbi:hypothetical protein ACFSTC_34730 [Nonomuraea ferruginea]
MLAERDRVRAGPVLLGPAAQARHRHHRRDDRLDRRGAVHEIPVPHPVRRRDPGVRPVQRPG